MYADLTAEELMEHEISAEVDPWGDERAEVLHGILCNLIDACHRSQEHGVPEPPIYYMPFAKKLEGVSQEQSQESMREILETTAASWGAK
jgi:hypothetical protein